MERNILIIDDDMKVLKSFKEILESEGYSVDIAETSHEALKKIKIKNYKLMFLDISPIELDLMNRNIPSRIIKILFNVHVSDGNLGVTEFLMKPVDPKKLIMMVEEKLRSNSKSKKESSPSFDREGDDNFLTN